MEQDNAVSSCRLSPAMQRQSCGAATAHVAAGFFLNHCALEIRQAVGEGLVGRCRGASPQLQQGQALL